MNRSDVLVKMLEKLWLDYKGRVSYAARYQDMVEQRGGLIINDHIALRTLNCKTGAQPAGAQAMERIFVPLGYTKKDKYLFDDKMLTAWHFEHSENPYFPKIFISQLEVDRLKPEAAKMIRECVANAPDRLSQLDQKLLASLGRNEDINDDVGMRLAENLTHFFSRPWNPPKRSIIAPVNRESQYAAWTLLNGNAVNHFTAYINAQNVPEWPDLETTVNALRQAGIPMKDEMEGERGSKLRQSSTQAVDVECEVTEDNGSPGKITWSYAYYELAERGMVPGPDGKPVLFQAFLGAQATNLFEMTRR